MNVQLREIANKAAGTYFIVTDNSAVETIAEISKLRLLFISSELGAVNTIVIFQQGDVASFRKVFGRTTRAMEKKGNYSLKTAEEALEGGALAVMNIRPFDDKLDKLTIAGLNASNKENETKQAAFTSVFNTNKLWTVTPKFMPAQLAQQHLVNIATVGTSDISVFFTVAKEEAVTELTAEGNETFRNTALEIDDYPAFDPDTLVKNTFVTAYVFNNTFDPATVGTNKYYGHLFDADGNLDSSKLSELCNIPEAGFNRSFTGSLIPNLKSEADADLSLDVIINQSYAETGLISFINDEVLEAEDTNVIDFDGSSYYDENGNLKADAAATMLSHVLPKVVAKTVVQYPPLASELQTIENAEVLFETEKISDTEFVGVFEQGIRVGDKIRGVNGGLVEVTGIEIIEENVPAIDPDAPKEKFPITINPSAHGTLIVKNGDEILNSGAEVDENTILSIEFKPLTDIVFEKFVVNGQDILNNPAEVYVTGATDISVVAKEKSFIVTFEQPEHGILQVSDTNGSITSGDEVVKGTALSINVVVNEGYELKDVKANGLSLGATIPVQGTVTSDLEITTVIEPKKLKVTITPNANGTISVKKNGVEVQNNSLVDYGTELTVEVTPNANYETKKVTANGNDIVGGKLNVTENVTIAAVIEAVQVTITTESSVNGTFIVKNGDEIVTSGTKVNSGTTLKIEPSPAENYEKNEIRVNNTVIIGTSFVAVNDSIIGVTFKQIKRTVTKNATQHGSYTVFDNADVEVISGGKVVQGTDIKIHVTPDENYTVDKVKVNGADVVVTDNTAVYTVSTLDMVIDVTFKAILYKVTIAKDVFTSEVRLYSDAEKTQQLNPDAIPGGTVAYIDVIPITGYEVKMVAINSIVDTSGVVTIDNSITISVSSQAKKFVLHNTSTEGGSLDIFDFTNGKRGRKIMDGGEIYYGQKLVWDINQFFDHVIDFITINGVKYGAEDTPAEVVVTGDVTFHGTFKVEEFSLTFPTNPLHGTIKVTGSESGVFERSPAMVLATETIDIELTPDEHYYALAYLDHETIELSALQNMEIDKNSIFTCNFMKIQHVVNIAPVQNGTVIVSSNSVPVADGGEVAEGDEIIITVTPDDETAYELDKIVVNDGTTDHELAEGVFRYTVLTPIRVIATLKPKTV